MKIAVVVVGGESGLSGGLHFGRFAFNAFLGLNSGANFTAMDGDFLGGLNSETNLIAPDFDHGDDDVFVDHNAFVFLARKYQHC